MSDFIALRCRSTGRLLTKADGKGIYLFCKQQNTQHLITWEQLKQMEREISLHTQKNPLYIDDDSSEIRVR